MKKLINKAKQLTLFDRILIFLTIIGIAFFALIFFRKSTFVTATVKINENNIQYNLWDIEHLGTRAWFAQFFKKEMKETDGLGRIMAEIVDVRSYDTEPARKAVYLTLKLNAVYERASGKYTFKGRPLLIGSPVKLNLGSLFVEGLVTHVEGIKDPRKWETVIVEAQIREEEPTYPDTSGTSPHIAEALQVGEEIKDDQGRIIIKIIEKKIEDAKRLVTTSDGRVVTKRNPLRKDVYLTLEVQISKIHNRYYIFDDIPLLIGEEIPINTPVISVWSEVTKITTKEK
jgi:hypothetical protein